MPPQLRDPRFGPRPRVIRSRPWCWSILTLLCVAAACGRSEPATATAAPPDFEAADSQLVSLTPEVLSAGVFLGAPTAIAVQGDDLVVLDFKSDSVVHVLRRSDGERILSFGGRGAQEEQYQGAMSIASAMKPGEYLVYDVSRRALRRVRDPRATGAPNSWLKFDIQSLTVQPEFINDSMLVAVGSYDSSRIAFFDAEGKLLRMSGRLPAYRADAGLPVQHLGYQSSLVIAPSRDRLVLLTRYAGQGQIFSADGTQTDSIRSPHPFPPAYIDEAGRMKVRPDTRLGYIAGAATDSLIFALFSGRSGTGTKPVHLASTIHVFDWRGHYRGGYRFPADLVAMAVDSTGRLLYGVQDRPYPAVLKMVLPALPEASQGITAALPMERGRTAGAR